MSTKNEKFGDYLKKKTSSKGKEHTHTRIGGGKDSKIYGGIYNILEKDYDEFLEKYYKHVFLDGNLEYITEKQLIENGPIMIDIDLHYEPEITERLHTNDHILDIVMLYADEISKIYNVSENVGIEVFVMEKKDVNKEDLKTKDGIHIIFGISMHKAAQVLLRKRVLDTTDGKCGLSSLWIDLPVKNTWEDVLDEGIVRGHVNWQVYGSRKPNNQCYLIKYHYKLEFNKETKWSVEIQDIAQFNTRKNLMKLSARYTKYPKFDYCDGIEDIVNKEKNTLNKKEGKKKLSYNIKKTDPGMPVNYSKISSSEQLDAIIEELFSDVEPMEHKLKETHQYTMSLPKNIMDQVAIIIGLE
tara:strand:+ start:1463 stop:2527 length:1065 start_codon:yes stop_codon:yes gene_type:complete